MGTTIYAFLADGFEEIEIFTAIDIFRRAGFEAVMVSTTGDEIVVGAHDVSVLCDAMFDNCDFSDADMLFLPGGLPGVEALEKHEGLRKLLISFAAKEKWIAAICAAPKLLGKLGLLNGYKATSYPSFDQYLEGAEWKDEMVVRDRNFITAMGPGSAMQLAFDIVEILDSKEKVAELKEAMCIKN